MTASKRKGLSKKIRFEVFKRDSFTCQYCGKSAPDVVLNVDHIQPIAKEGTNDLVNLVSACVDCNAGKGATTLDDQSVVAKQRRQLQETNERLEQIKLMAKWRKDLTQIGEAQVNVIDDRIGELCNCRLTPSARREFTLTIKKYGLDDVLSALEKSANQYLIDENSPKDREKFINYTHRICYWQQKRKTHPEVAQFSYICGIAAKKRYKISKQDLWRKLEYYFYDCGVGTDAILDLVKSCSGIMEFKRQLASLAGDADGQN